MSKRVANVSVAIVVVALVLGAAACGSSTPTGSGDTGGTTTVPRPSSIDTVASKPSVPVSRPAEPRDIPISDLPDEMRLNPARLGLEDSESNCVDTAVYEYLQGPGAAADETAKATALGTAVIVCVGRDEIVSSIVRQVRVDDATMTEEQAECIRNDLATSEDQALAELLGAFLYGPVGIPEMAAPFAASIEQACNYRG
jgi:hypothetical protein